MAIINFLHTYNPSPVLATIGPFTLYWYGLFYAISIALGYWLVASTLKRILSTDYSLLTTHSTTPRLYGSMALWLTARLPEFSFGLIVSGLVGARIYHVLNEWSYYWAHPLQIFAIWNGGLAIHGALIVGLIYLWWYSKKLGTQNAPHFAGASRGKERRTQGSTALWLYGSMAYGSTALRLTAYGLLLDLLSPAVLLGQAIGRWGNYFNQELFGYPTSLPWGIPISLANRPPEFAEFTYFHPTFLYESIWDLVGFIILFILQRQLTAYLSHEAPPSGAKWGGLLVPRSPAARDEVGRLTARPGFIFFSYLLWVSLGRFLVELLRIDTVPTLFNIRTPLAISAVIIVASICALTMHITIRYNRQ